jgi:hypothetical protein
MTSSRPVVAAELGTSSLLPPTGCLSPFHPQFCFFTITGRSDSLALPSRLPYAFHWSEILFPQLWTAVRLVDQVVNQTPRRCASFFAIPVYVPFLLLTPSYISMLCSMIKTVVQTYMEDFDSDRGMSLRRTKSCADVVVAG